jgi:hypothetical protein
MAGPVKFPITLPAKMKMALPRVNETPLKIRIKIDDALADF